MSTPRSTGPMRDRLAIQRRASTANPSGEQSGDWQTIGAPVWAEVRPARASEIVNADALEGQVVYAIRMRDPRPLRMQARMRLVELTGHQRIFDVTGTLPTSRRDWLMVSATEYGA